MSAYIFVWTMVGKVKKVHGEIPGVDVHIEEGWAKDLFELFLIDVNWSCRHLGLFCVLLISGFDDDDGGRSADGTQTAFERSYSCLSCIASNCEGVEQGKRYPWDERIYPLMETLVS